jgi:xylan 1,4-beta-xylosidase
MSSPSASTSAAGVFRNPVLRGFFPDPSICRVGHDYYLANSTFEWFPGIPLHHSRDLVNWRLVGHALTRTSQLDLSGIADSAGVWAPSLSWCDGQFWLVYGAIRTAGAGRPFKDIKVCLVTAPSIQGPWSEPVFLHANGFDPSLFHDDDGRKWLVNMQWDFRKDRPRFAGIILQEYDQRQRKLIGPLHSILQKPVLTEGPNLYKRDGWYYLMLAEGGTGWNHGISMARSRRIEGPYELDPQEAVLTTRHDLNWPLQKAGHGELVQTPAGEWWLAHLCSRPVAPERRCILGRETALQRVTWTGDGWLRLAHGDVRPLVELATPAGLVPHAWPVAAARDDFNGATLDPRWSTLRVAADESWLTLRARPGWLRLRGRDSQHSLFEQSLVARRLGSVHARVETRLEFSPAHFSHMAGLICWYDTRTHFYLRATHDETLGKILGVAMTEDGNYNESLPDRIAIGDWEAIYLRAEIAATRLQFFASPDGHAWQAVGPALDASKLSDDYGSALHFTGAMVGVCVQDLSGAALHADFDYFTLEEREA